MDSWHASTTEGDVSPTEHWPRYGEGWTDLSYQCRGRTQPLLDSPTRDAYVDCAPGDDAARLTWKGATFEEGTYRYTLLGTVTD